MKIQSYHKENMIQKNINKFFNLFRRDQDRIDQLVENGIKVYNPKLNKVKVGVGVAGCVGCLLTPATNWIIPFIVGWIVK